MKQFLEIYPELKMASERFYKNDYQFFLVGGCVRDFLLKKEPKDIDVVTNALPDVVEELFKDFKVLTIGKSFGIIKVLFPSGFELEIATFRKDIGSTDGRRPDSVEFTTAEEDVKRRDFTINGLLYDIKNDEIIDYVGGQRDLADGIVRTIGSTEERFKEDSLRKLRALRFSHTLNFSLSKEIVLSLQKDNSLEGVSNERIVDELTKMFKKSLWPSILGDDLRRYGYDRLIFNLPFQSTCFLTNSVSISLAKLFDQFSPATVYCSLKDAKFDNNICKRVEFLLQLKQKQIGNILVLKKFQESNKISDDYIERFANLYPSNPLQKYLKAFVNYGRLTNHVQVLLESGLKGEELGKKLTEMEIESFTKFLES